MPPSARESKSVLILYGSETGMAEDSAVDLGNMIQRLRFDTVVDEMDSFKLVRVFPSYIPTKTLLCKRADRLADPMTPSISDVDHTNYDTRAIYFVPRSSYSSCPQLDKVTCL